MWATHMTQEEKNMNRAAIHSLFHLGKKAPTDCASKRYQTNVLSTIQVVPDATHKRKKSDFTQEPKRDVNLRQY